MKCEAEGEWKTLEGSLPTSTEDPKAMRASEVSCTCGGNITAVLMASSSSVQNTGGRDDLSVSGTANPIGALSQVLGPVRNEWGCLGERTGAHVI